MKIDLTGPAFGPPNLTTPSGQLRVVAVAQPVRKIQVKGGCTGIWEVIRDDRFYGHFTGYRAAMEAAAAAAEAIVASGGAADIDFDPNGMMRTMEFRTGAVPIVR
jgi:hypothetical protein